MTIQKSMLALGVSLALPALGLANTQDVDQTGSGHMSTIVQSHVAYAASNAATVNQSGADQESNISVTGDGNTTTVDQDGGPNLSNISIVGNDNQATVLQDFFGNTATVSIAPLDGVESANNVVLVDQLTGAAAGNTANVSLSRSSGNTINATQNGDNSVANISTDFQFDSVINTTQDSSTGVHTINISMFNGTGNTVDVLQDYGADNTASISTNGSGNDIDVSQVNSTDSFVTVALNLSDGNDIDVDQLDCAGCTSVNSVQGILAE